MPDSKLSDAELAAKHAEYRKRVKVAEQKSARHDAAAEKQQQQLNDEAQQLRATISELWQQLRAANTAAASTTYECCMCFMC